ncbi:hypothetical protein B0H17DRAFT_229767 [Mycena rosella]|uniref:Uncharacterized protein n=1 Tax=Mycena rosella TaxID=1033263 RepID=A0AAD7H143_MYCRO|nr:hypothetical protein B0H17DRAFT_229767 [Mycena rosella]
MDDADQDSPLHTVLCSDNLNAIVVAVTFATLFLTSSALIFRSGRRLGFSPHVGGVSLTSPASQADSDAPTKDPKNSRSKERRRRGKDPLKEILKGGKKLKMTSFSRDHDIGSSTSASTSPFPESGSSQRSASISTSSRSVSVSSSNSAAAAGLTITDLAARDSDNGNATPSRKPSGRAHDASRPSAPDFEPPNGLRDISEVPEPPIPSNSSAESTSLTTPTTSPSVSPSENTSSGSTVLLHTYYSSDAQGTENPPPAPPKSSRPIIGSTAGGTPRRVSTPRRTPTPSSDGNASLNSQTQIASLREELEAAHMREEQAKADLDCCAKDCEMMHWENNTWRLREFEVNKTMRSVSFYTC